MSPQNLEWTLLSIVPKLLLAVCICNAIIALFTLYYKTRTESWPAWVFFGIRARTNETMWHDDPTQPGPVGLLRLGPKGQRSSHGSELRSVRVPVDCHGVIALYWHSLDGVTICCWPRAVILIRVALGTCLLTSYLLDKPSYGWAWRWVCLPLTACF